MSTDSPERGARVLDVVRERYDEAAEQHRNELAERIERERKRAAWAVEIFNLLCPPGTPVTLTDDAGEQNQTKTRSKARQHPCGTPVVSVEGRTGGYLLWRIKPRLNLEERRRRMELWELLNEHPGEHLQVGPSENNAGYYLARDRECVTTEGTIRCMPWLRWSRTYWACCHPDLDGCLEIAAGTPPPPEYPLRRGQEEIARKLGEELPQHPGHGDPLRCVTADEEPGRYKRLATELHDCAAEGWQIIRNAAPHDSDERARANDVCDQLLEGGRLWLPPAPSPWIDIADRLPADGAEVLVLTDRGIRRVAIYNEHGDKRFIRHDGTWPDSSGEWLGHETQFRATHWMPLADVPSPVLPKPLDPGGDYHPVDVRPGEFPMPPKDSP